MRNDEEIVRKTKEQEGKEMLMKDKRVNNCEKNRDKEENKDFDQKMKRLAYEETIKKRWRSNSKKQTNNKMTNCVIT